MTEADELVGATIAGKYRIRRLIGAGGMGSVYEGQHVDLGKKVAVKVLDAVAHTSAELATRFKREARAASAVESDGMYRFKLPTPIGEMGVSLWESAIMCRFEDVPKATEFTRHHTSQSCNPYSGKWNWHYDDDPDTLNSQCESDFVRYLTKLLSLERLPQDLTTMTPAQTERVVEMFSKMPLRELRRRQDLTHKQMELAFELRNDEVLANLQVRAEHLRLAVQRKVFG